MPNVFKVTESIIHNYQVVRLTAVNANCVQWAQSKRWIHSTHDNECWRCKDEPPFLKELKMLREGKHLHWMFKDQGLQAGTAGCREAQSRELNKGYLPGERVHSFNNSANTGQLSAQSRAPWSAGDAGRVRRSLFTHVQEWEAGYLTRLFCVAQWIGLGDPSVLTYMV